MPHPAAGRALIAIAIALAALPAAAIYKWVDEKGVTHFSETPPPDGRKATKVEPRVVPPSQKAAPTDWKQREQESRKRRIEREASDETARAKAHNEAAERANRCNLAKRDLQVLGLQVPVFSRNDRGEKVYVEDKDRASEIAEARRRVEANCDAP